MILRWKCWKLTPSTAPTCSCFPTYRSCCISSRGMTHVAYTDVSAIAPAASGFLTHEVGLEAFRDFTDLLLRPSTRHHPFMHNNSPSLHSSLQLKECLAASFPPFDKTSFGHVHAPLIFLEVLRGLGGVDADDNHGPLFAVHLLSDHHGHPQPSCYSGPVCYGCSLPGPTRCPSMPRQDGIGDKAPTLICCTAALLLHC